MTHHRRRQLLCALFAVPVGAVAAWSAAVRLWVPACVLALALPVLLTASARAGRAHRTLVAAYRRAARAAAAGRRGESDA
ncbi:hypothetical protein [Streptomyces naganishii]|uniref:Uncharacterized protein n=1 Tax=Streptomyces naganishii JCM 4654 TaxID=1306179 RepID=A0A918XZK4_9ACTN|nr:hypothetical protein [Streptomyces naganishii]GHD85819.1 hypothetical protein GCM10010508_10880 [Streptomyces naganishii JCM 4654]